MSLPHVVVTLALVALASGPAWAAPKAPAAQREKAALPQRSAQDCDAQFKLFDANQDGKLTYAEYAQASFDDLRFVRAPTPQEVARHKRQFAAAARAADANQDGWLTLREHRTGCQSGL